MIRIGVIGAGPIAAHHLQVLTALEGITVTALSSRRQDARDALARQFGIPHQCDQYEDLLAQPIDAVLVLVAPDAMAEVTRAALVRSIPTFLEKPPGLTLRDAESLAELAHARGVLNQVGLNRRFYSVVAGARSAMEQSGRVFGIHVEAPEAIDRARAAGRSEHILRNWMAANSLHAIDLLRHLGGGIRTRHLIRQPGERLAETSMAALFQFESGAIGQFTAYWGSPGRWSVSMYGRNVSAVLTPLEQGSIRYADGSQHALGADEVDVMFKPGFYRQHETFIARLRGNATTWPAPDLHEAAKSMELAHWLAGGTA